MEICTETIDRLIEICNGNGDEFLQETLCEALESFEAYHMAIYTMETKRRVYSAQSMDRQAYQDMVERLDKDRTRHHNSVLANVNLLNRMAAAENLKPVYDGIVSEERPYRREVANAVLAYVEDVIKKRG